MITIENLEKSFSNGENTVKILKGISVTIPKNKFVTILGPSGSGKTTFLNIIAGLETYEAGAIAWGAQNLAELSAKELEALRIDQIGYVFQDYFLLNNLTLIENVLLSGKMVGKSRIEAARALTAVGLYDHRNKLPDQLSGGQKQRVAIARALLMEPRVLCYDEPTSALDPALRDSVAEIILNLKNDGMTQIIVTHDHDFAKKIADQLIEVAPI